MRKKAAFVFFIGALCLTAACNKERGKEEMLNTGENNNPGHQLPFQIKYSRLFDIQYLNGYKKITLFSPWNKDKVYYSYILVNNPEVNVPRLNGEIIVKTPVKNIITLSTTHIGLLDALNLESRIAGISNSGFVYNEAVRKRIESREIIEVGHQNQLNVESIIDMRPGLIMSTGFEDFNENLRLIEKGGVPVAYNLEYMEHSLLARAEWIKFVAAFFNCDNLADSLFNEIEHKYILTQREVIGVRDKPRILFGKMNKGTWYVAGGKSYVAQLLKDAGADYYWKNDPTRGSIPMSFESIMENQMDADVWIDPSRVTSLRDLVKEDEKYKRFKAFSNKQVYGFIKRELKSGANDYWESGLVNPHIILADMIKIIHPQLLPGYELIYYKKLD